MTPWKWRSRRKFDHAMPREGVGRQTQGSKELEEFKKTGEPAKQFTDIGRGPDGMTVKAADEQTLEDY